MHYFLNCLLIKLEVWFCCICNDQWSMHIFSKSWFSSLNLGSI